MSREREDVIALTYAGAFLIEVRGTPVATVAAMLNDHRAQVELIGNLIASSAWRNQWQPWLRCLYNDFRKIGHERRNLALRRLLPGLAVQEVVTIERGEARSMTKTPEDSLATLDFGEQFFLIVRATVRRYAEKRDVRAIVEALE